MLDLNGLRKRAGLELVGEIGGARRRGQDREAEDFSMVFTSELWVKATVLV